MPKIPTYNQGLGPAVRLQTGQLSPRASAAAFTAPGRAQQQLGRTVQNVAKVAAEFEMARQNAEVDEIASEYENVISDSYGELNRQDTSNIDDYRSAEETLRQGLMSGVDGMDRLSKRQKLLLKDTVEKKAALYKVDGEKATWTRWTNKATETGNKRAISMRSDIVSGTMPFELGVSEYRAYYNKQLSTGVQLQLTPEQFEFSIKDQQLLALTQDESKDLDYFEDLQDDILDGVGEFATADYQQNERLAARVGRHVSRIQGAFVAEQKEGIDDAIATIQTAKEDDDRNQAFVNGMANVAGLERAGQFAAAATARAQLSATLVLADSSYDMAFESTQEINERMELERQALNNAPDELKAEALAGYQVIESYVKNRQNLIQEDPAAYVQGEFFRLYDRQPRAQEVIDLQRQMGVSEISISPFSNAEFDALKTSLTGAGADDSIKLMSDFFGRFNEGEQRDLAMGAAMRKGMTVTQNLVMTNPFDPRAKDLLNSANVDDAILKAALESRSIKRAEVNTAVATELSDYTASYVGVGAGGYLDQTSTAGRMNTLLQIQSSMSRLAQTYMASDPSLSKTDAAKRAVTFITDRYDIRTDVRNKSTVRIPVEQSANASVIMRTLTRKLVQPGFAESLVPPSASGVASDVSEESRRSIFATEVRRGARWATTDDDTGVVLLDPFGQPLFFGGTTDTVSYTWEEIMGMHSPEAEQILEAITGAVPDAYAGAYSMFPEEGLE